MRHVVLVLALLVAALAAPGTIRADDATPGAAGVELVTLVSVTFPAGDPLTGRLSFGLQTATYGPAGSRSNFGDDRDAGFGVDLVTAGGWAVRAEGSVVALGGPAGPPEPVPPGTEVELQAGDAVAYPRLEVLRSARTVGDEEATVLGVYLRGPELPSEGEPTPSTGEVTASYKGVSLEEPYPAQAGLDGGPVTVTLRRVTMAPGAALPPLVDAAFTVRYVVEGVAAWGVSAPGEATPASLDTTEAGGLPFVPYALLSGFVPGGFLYIANGGETPLVFLEASIGAAPADATPIPTAAASEPRPIFARVRRSSRGVILSNPFGLKERRRRA